MELQFLQCCLSIVESPWMDLSCFARLILKFHVVSKVYSTFYSFSVRLKCILFFQRMTVKSNRYSSCIAVKTVYRSSRRKMKFQARARLPHINFTIPCKHGSILRYWLFDPRWFIVEGNPDIEIEITAAFVTCWYII